MNEIKRVEPAPLATTGQSEVAELIRLALSQGQQPTELYAILREERAHRSSQAFNAGLAAFQAECPPISRTSSANIVSDKGAKFSYKYAELDEIARTIRPLLEKHGLAYSWDSKEAAGVLTCICTLRHRDGHSSTATFSCPTETRAGMSAMQKSASALTYARRQSLIQALGLTTCDPDDDGAQHDPITPAQVSELERLITETESNRDRFLGFAGATRIEDISNRKYPALLAALKSKAKKPAEATT